ncbi:MAG: hypothetical protein IPJ95_02935 [Gemmatimonadetes bacterium]|nr:hypothetical protein [Gemmatimonadota bacterium]
MRRRGAALPVALLLLALLGALAGLVLVASRVRVLAGARALDHARLEAAARGAIEWHLFQWAQVHPDTLAVGATAPLAPPAWAGVPLADTLTRTGQAGFLLAATAERRAADGGILARSSAGQLVRLAGAASPDTAALVAFGPVTLLDSVRVSGIDSLPATSWAPACPPPAPPQPGVRSRLATADCPGGGCVAGAPPLLQDSAVAPAATYPLGPHTVATLRASADHRLPAGLLSPAPATAGAGCDRSQLTNWGDPMPSAGPCGGWFPVVEVADGGVVVGGVGQGILLGAGRLTLGGGLRFVGLVLALGPLELRDSVRVAGQVIGLDSVRVGDGVSLMWSACAAMMSGTNSARPIAGSGRWFLGH